MGDEYPMQSKVIAEFTGTFMLIFTVGCNVLSETPVWAGVSIACVLMVAIYCFGGVSGGNFNPAVSIMLGIIDTMKPGLGMGWKDVGIYCVTQIVAGILAGFCYFGLFGHTFNLAPAKGFGWLSACTCELLYTFMLCLVVANTAVAEKVKGNKYYGLAIGFVVVAGAYGAGAVSGGCFNPAVALGIDVSSAHLGIGWSLVYTAAELIGCALAAFAFLVIREEETRSELAEGGAASATLVVRLLCEFLGTYFLVVTVGLNVLGKSPAGAFSIAAALMCMIYALGPVSGAHFNPAVTLAILVYGETTPKEAGAYMVSQIAGGIAAAFTYASIYSGETFPLGPGPGYGWSQVSIAEFFFTFVLCMVVLTVAVNPKTNNGTMFGLAIGSCVTVGGFAIGSISGGSLNPAVSFGIGATQILDGGTLFCKAFFYSVVEFAAAAAAAGLVKTTHPPMPKAEAISSA